MEELGTRSTEPEHGPISKFALDRTAVQVDEVLIAADDTTTSSDEPAAEQNASGSLDKYTRNQEETHTKSTISLIPSESDVDGCLGPATIESEDFDECYTQLPSANTVQKRSIVVRELCGSWTKVKSS